MLRPVPAVAVALLLAAAAPVSHAAVLFFDDMPGTFGSGQQLLPQGRWDGIRHSADTGDAAQRDGIAIDEATDPGTNSRRLFIGMPASSVRQSMLFTPQTQFDAAVTLSQAVQDYDPTSWDITYWTRNDDSASPNFAHRLALKVGGTWYVRNTASSQIAGPLSSWLQWEVQNPFGTSGWTPITTVDETGLATLSRITLTGTATLPSTGDLQGFALWATSTTNYGLRLDVVSISATPVPEPASLGALAVGAVALLFRRR